MVDQEPRQYLQELRQMESDERCLNEHRKQWQLEHRDQWVAVHNGVRVAIAPNRVEMLQQVKDLGIDSHWLAYDKMRNETS